MAERMADALTEPTTEQDDVIKVVTVDAFRKKK